jgi:ribose transport system substrate-binding protein
MFRTVNRTRVLPIVLAIGVVTSLSACGSGDGGGGSAGDSSTPAAGGVSVDVGTGTIAPHDMEDIAVMIQAGPTYSDSASKAEGAKQAGEDLGVNVEIYWSALDPATEVSNYNTIMTSGKFGGLAVQAVSAQLCKTIAADSVKSQTLVSVFGGPLCAKGDETGDDLWAPGTVTYVDQNNLVNGATTMFEGAAELLGDGPQKVMLVLGSEGHPTQVGTEKAWDDFAAEHPDWTLAGKIYTDWTTPGAFSSTQNLLQANPDATVLFTPYVDITAGVVKAVAAQNMTDKVSVFETAGGTDLSVELLNAGTLTGSVPSHPYDVGYSAVEALVEAGSGTMPPPVIYQSEERSAMITKENVGSYTP